MLSMIFALENVKPLDVFDVQILGVQNLFMDGSKDGAKLWTSPSLIFTPILRGSKHFGQPPSKGRVVQRGPLL